VREVVRLVQDKRKASGLAVSDRISLVWSAEDDLAGALRAASDLVADEVLATSITERTPEGDVVTEEALGLSFAIAKA